MVIAGLAVSVGIEYSLGPLATAYVLILVVLGPLTARYTEPVATWLRVRLRLRERCVSGRRGSRRHDVDRPSTDTLLTCRNRASEHCPEPAVMIAQALLQRVSQVRILPGRTMKGQFRLLMPSDWPFTMITAVDHVLMDQRRARCAVPHLPVRAPRGSDRLLYELPVE